MPSAERARRRGASAGALALVLAAAGIAVAPASAATHAVAPTTVPAIAGVRVRSGGQIVRTGAGGVVPLTLPSTVARGSSQGRSGPGAALPEVLPTRLPDGVEARFGGFFDGGRTIGLSLYTRARLRYVRPDGRRIPPGEVEQAVLESSTGVRVVVHGTRTPWLQASRVVRGRSGLRSTPIQYSLESVTVGGSNVVHRAQWRFRPLSTRRLKVPLLLYALRFTSADALFGKPIGTAVLLTHPDGRTTRLPLHDGVAEAAGLPRGAYRVRVEARGYSFEHPVALSRNQLVDMQVISLLDVAVVGGALGAIALALLLIGRPRLRRRLLPLPRRVTVRR